jgi:hypothetical protein
MQDIYFSSPSEVIAQSADSWTVNLTYTETRRVPSVVGKV